MNDTLANIIVEGMKQTGNFRDCKTYIEEGLSEDDFNDVEQFFFWLDANGLTIGPGNIHDRYARYEQQQHPGLSYWGHAGNFHEPKQ